MTRRSYGAKEAPRKATRWVQLEHYLIDSAAYKALSANAKVICTEIKRRYNGKNNGMVSLSSREAGNTLNATHHTGARALTELSEYGFIAITAKSNFSRKVKLATQYRLSEVSDDRPGLAAPPTKAFLKWRPVAADSVKVTRTGEFRSRTDATEAAEKVEIRP